MKYTAHISIELKSNLMMNNIILKKSKVIVLVLALTISVNSYAKLIKVSPGNNVQAILEETLHAGDTIFLLSGVHTITAMIYLDANGTEADPVVIMGESGTIISHHINESQDYAIRALNPTYLIIRDITFDGWYDGAIPSDRCHLRFDNGHHVSVINCELKNNQRNAINLLGVRDVLLDSLNIHHAILYDGEFIDAHGIIGYNQRNVTISNTHIWAVSGDCIQTDPGYDEIEWDSLMILNCRLDAAILDTGWYTVPKMSDIGENAIDFKTPYTPNLPNPNWKAYVYMKNVTASGFKFDTLPLANRNYNDRAAFLLKQAVNVTMDSCTVTNSEYGWRIRGESEWLGNPLPSCNAKLINCFSYDCETPLWFEEIDPEYIEIRNSVFELGKGTEMLLMDETRLDDVDRPPLWIEVRTWEDNEGTNNLEHIKIVNCAFPNDINSIEGNIYIDSLNLNSLQVPDLTEIDGFFVNPNTLPTAFSEIPEDFVHSTILQDTTISGLIDHKTRQSLGTVLVYTNSATGTVYVKTDQNCLIRILNIMGKVVHEQYKSETLMAINYNFEKGIYIVQTINSSNNQTYSLKFIIK